MKNRQNYLNILTIATMCLILLTGIGVSVGHTATISGLVKTSGGIGIPGVTFGGLPTLPNDPITDETGYYLISGTALNGWSGTVTPSKEGYSFDPPERTYTNHSGEVTGEDYTGVQPTISGYVTTSEGGGIPDVTFTGLPTLPNDPITDETGYYMISGTALNGWSGTVTPYKDDYSFEPPDRSYTNLSDQVTGEDYVAQQNFPEINVKQETTDVPNGTGSYDFGTVNVSSSSAAITFTIQNTGSADLVLSGIQKTGDHPNDFTITQPLSSNVAPSGSTTFTIIFSPPATGIRIATLSIANNDSDEHPYTFTVTGTGQAQASNSFILWTK